VFFLVTGRYNLATVYIVGRADVGEYGVAIIYSAVLVIFMMDPQRDAGCRQPTRDARGNPAYQYLAQHHRTPNSDPAYA
jgi:hypothetical protein